jgi:hypothetical protein
VRSIAGRLLAVVVTVVTLGAFTAAPAVADPPIPAPTIDGTASGVGLPHQITLRPAVPDVTGWVWKIFGTEGDFSEIHHVYAKPAGTAVITVTLPEPGLFLFSVSALLLHGESGGEASTYFTATSVPIVSSGIYLPGDPGGVGVADTFTFRPNTADVIGYDYAFGDDPDQFVSAIDGVATVTWAPSASGENRLRVTSYNAQYKPAETGTWYFDVG